MQDLEKLYEEYALGVYKFLLKLSGSQSVAEDLTQETFYKAMLSIDKFKGNCKLYVWLCQIAKNEYINYCKKSERKNKSLETTVDKDSKDYFEQIYDTQQSKQIHKALHVIGEPYKEVFSLRAFAELSFKDIAELFNKSDSWARVTFFRAKQKIIELIEED